MQEFKKALCPDDVNYEELNSDMNIARKVSKKEFKRDYEKKVKRKYFLFVAGIAFLGILIIGPGLMQVGKDLMIDSFYKRFLKKEVAGQFEMLVELSDWQKDLYTNNYTNEDEGLTDEEKSAQAQTKYYDFQLGKYVTHEKFDTSTEYYEYMKIDYWEDEIWVSYVTELGNTQMVIDMVPVAEDTYKITTAQIGTKGQSKQNEVYINYKKQK